MKLAGVNDVEDGHADCTEAQGHRFDWVGVLCGQAEWCGVPVVLFVDVFVEDTVMEEAMGPVVPNIFEDEEEGDFPDHGPDGREGNLGGDAQFFTHGVEGPNGDGLNQEVGEQDGLEAEPLFFQGGDLCGLDLVASEPFDVVDEEPREASEEVHELVQGKEEQARGKPVIAHVDVPGGPVLFNEGQGRVVIDDVVQSENKGGILQGICQGGISEDMRHD